MMLEIVYRIYEKTDDYRDQYRKEITMDCLICESRERFKEIIRDTYGNDMAFAKSKNLEVGDLYCIIIGEHCWNTDKYFNRVEFLCDGCGLKVITHIKPVAIDEHTVRHRLFGDYEKYHNKRFCSERCRDGYVNREVFESKANDEDEFFVTRDMFSQEYAVGYVYKITKRSTSEFYVGQTVYAPVFRWGQHLKSERFDIKDIENYVFEVIEIVKKGANLLEREAFWIQKLYQENPTLSLNLTSLGKTTKSKSKLKLKGESI